MVLLLDDDGWKWHKYGHRALLNSSYDVKHYFKVIMCIMVSGFIAT